MFSTLWGLDWQTAVKYGIALIGLAIGYGKMQSDVGYLKDDSKAMRAQVNSIFEHLAWGNKGEIGPAPPAEDIRRKP